MSYIKINFKADRPNGFAFKILEKDGIIFITEVLPNGAAMESGMRSGDRIIYLNDEQLECSADDFVKKMNNIRGELQLTVYRDDIDADLPRSASNCSDRFDQISNNSFEKLTTSTSSNDLNSSGHKNQILGENYVPEEHIDSYIQPMSTNYVDSPDPPLYQITRKEATRRPTNENLFSDAPRYSVKRATKSSSVYTKEPVYSLKRRTNVKMSDVAQVVTSLSQVPRRSTEPIYSDKSPSLSTNNSASASNTVSPLASVDNSSCPLIQQTTSSLLSLSESMQVETMMKVLVFKDKVKKTCWNTFLIENDTLGVQFNCCNPLETVTPDNCTAIDPYISGLQAYMNLWHANNNMYKFFLPIGQEAYNDRIEMFVNTDNITVKYADYDLEFLINFSRLSEEKVSTLFSILGVKQELPEPKPIQAKPKRLHSSTDNLKPETRKVRPQRNQSDLPRDLVLSNLPQTKLIENVPVVVLVCVGIIERIGVQKQGIYRLSGNEAAKKRLENLVLTQSPDTWAQCQDWISVNTVASMLKSILRNYGLIDRDTAIKLSMINVMSEGNQLQNLMDMVYHLRQHLCKPDPPRLDSVMSGKDRSPQEQRCRLETLKYLIRHLHNVSKCANHNMMTADNLATCFSPTLIEDIPCDEEEYKTSKKSDADRNLKQMVCFWILNAELICDLLDEDEEQQRFHKLTQFSESKKEEVVTEEEVDCVETESTTMDTEKEVKEIMEKYTSETFVPGSDNGSLTVTDGSFFTKIKNVSSYQSLRKKETHPRRDGANMSPQETRKMTSVDINVESVKHVSTTIAPLKRMDNWATKSVRVRRKEPQLPQRKELSLASMRLSDSVKNVPVVVDICVTLLERFGLDVDGMYRISGKKHDINVLEELILTKKYNNLTDDPYLTMWSNLYTVSGLLKSILKQFCLIKKVKWVHMFSQFSEKIEPADVRKVLMAAAYHLRHETRKRTPPTTSELLSPGYVDRAEEECEEDIQSATLRYVLRHLNLVAQHAVNNRMVSSSLAVCFMPVLMEEDDSGDIMAINNKGIQITEKLIDHCNWIFQWDNRRVEEIYGKEMTDSLDEYLKKFESQEMSTDVQKLADDTIPSHIIDCNYIKPLLDKAIAKSCVNFPNRLTLRRHSDETDSSTRKLGYRQSKMFDDSQLPDNILTNNGFDDHSNDFQLPETAL